MHPAPLTAANQRSNYEVDTGEALRMYWSVYWRAIVGQIAVLLILQVVLRAVGVSVGPIPSILIQWILFTGMLYTALSRLLEPFRGFRVHLVNHANEDVPFTTSTRRQILLFLVPRLAGWTFVAMLVLSPVSMFWGIIRFAGGAQIQSMVVALFVGVAVFKMLVNHCFSDFRLEIRRAAR